MNVTKYPQSCLLIEDSGTRIVIDPGTLFTAKYERGDLGELDGVLYTHIHADHLDEALAKMFADESIPLYGNQSVVNMLDQTVNLLDDGDIETIGAIEVEARDLPHCLTHNGQSGPQNTGFIINGALFHPGDGVSVGGVDVENLAAPIAGPSISPRTAFDLAQQVGADTIIPIHYDYWLQNPEVIKSKFEADGLTVHVLDNGESVDLS
jgi:L-ascorbate metabolism protein UlaG (beta-lactamase superfamily)